MHRSTWQTTVHGVAKCQTRLNNYHFFFFPNSCMTGLFYLAHCPPLSSTVSNGIFFRLNSILLYTQTYYIFLIHLAVKGPLKWKSNSLSYVRLFATPSTPISPWNSPGQSTDVGQNISHSLLQGIFPTQGLNPGLPHCKVNSLPAEPPGNPMDLWVVCISWILWQGLQWTWDCRYFFKILISILLDKCPEVVVLDHMLVLFLIFEVLPYCFP